MPLSAGNWAPILPLGVTYRDARPRNSRVTSLVWGLLGSRGMQWKNKQWKTGISTLAFALALAVGGCTSQARENAGEAVEEPFEEIDEHTGADTPSDDEDDFEPDEPGDEDSDY